MRGQQQKYPKEQALHCKTPVPMSPHWPVATTLHYSPRHKTRESERQRERERERERHFPSFKKKSAFTDFFTDDWPLYCIVVFWGLLMV